MACESRNGIYAWTLDRPRRVARRGSSRSDNPVRWISRPCPASHIVRVHAIGRGAWKFGAVVEVKSYVDSLHQFLPRLVAIGAKDLIALSAISPSVSQPTTCEVNLSSNMHSPHTVSIKRRRTRRSLSYAYTSTKTTRQEGIDARAIIATLSTASAVRAGTRPGRYVW